MGGHRAGLPVVTNSRKVLLANCRTRKRVACLRNPARVVQSESVSRVLFQVSFPATYPLGAHAAPGDFLGDRDAPRPQSITTRLRVCASVVTSLTRSSAPNTTWNSAKLLSQKRQILASSCGFSLLTG